MTCCTADPVRATLGAADPKKHVNYVLGMVLGVDDLNQEFVYQDNRVRAVVRELIGYGTDRGLAVSLEASEQGPRVRIANGVAYVPSGQMVCVGSDQCALLNDWLAAHAAELTQRFGAAADANLRLAIALCYRECLTDKVPIPGDPCRSEDALMSPSRVKDEFSLELRFSPPVQTEEDAVRELVRWLRAIPLETGSPPSTIEDLRDALRDAASPWLDLASPPEIASPLDSPPGSPPQSSPPAPLDLGDPPVGLAIPPGACAEYLRAAFLYWVTKLRPAWIARFGGCHACGCDDAHDDCVLLAELNVPILAQSPGGWVVSDIEPVVIDETRRPYLLHARMMQEWLLANCACEGSVVASPPQDSPPQDSPPQGPLPDLGGDLSGPIENGVVQKIQGVNVIATGANDKQVLTFAGGAWRPANAAAAPATLDGDITGPLGAALLDKIHGVPVVTTGPPALDDVLGFDGANWTPRPVGAAAPPLPALAGDVGGAIVANEVTGIRAQPVNAPTAGDNGAALVFAGNHWEFARFAPTGKYVEYADSEKGYAIVAAGRFGFQVDGRDLIVKPFGYATGGPPVRPFNKLSVANVGPLSPLPCRIEFTFSDYEARLEKGVMIVKATPGWLTPETDFKRSFPKSGLATGAAFHLMFNEFTKRTFVIAITAGPGIDGLQQVAAGEMEIEVSWYPGR